MVDKIVLIKKCKKCQKEFKQKRGWQSFCTTQCRNDYHNEKVLGRRAVSEQK